ncbi:hypothetical protein [Burkholderia sp. S-53]|uniref:hypothetical protein n=1 Tax=Burkholderia sp. S-53 TaxID=2906514 RepID=UPI0021D30E4D|nr:hypothetical protein [Burkholderia sp. S-53]UXU89936.1 hypothetical protein LXM88_31915 [Burkholderia sp. S-53]
MAGAQVSASAPARRGSRRRGRHANEFRQRVSVGPRNNGLVGYAAHVEPTDSELRNVGRKTLVFPASIFVLVQAIVMTGMLLFVALRRYELFGTQFALVAPIVPSRMKRRMTYRHINDFNQIYRKYSRDDGENCRLNWNQIDPYT